MLKRNNNKNNKGFPYIATLIAFLAIVIMLGLGFWQLDRKAQKETRITNIQTAALSDDLQLSDISETLSEYQDYTVVIKGQAEHSLFFIDNKLIQGRAGFYVLVPYRTKLGIMMVNLGWVPANGVRGDLPDLTPILPSEIRGIVYVPTLNTLISETNTEYSVFPVLLQQVNLEEIEKHLGEPVLPAVLRMNEDSSEFIREWQAVTMSPEKHLGYAIQWFGLAIAALTVFLLSLLKWMHAPSPTGNNE